MSFAYMALFTGDYLRDTRHLTPQKHGVYLLLLMHCWDQKGPLPLDEQECAGIANCRSSDEVDSLRYILDRYFTRMEDGYYNKRMQKEIERMQNVSGARSIAGRKGYQAKAKQLLSKSQALVSTPSPSPSLLYPQKETLGEVSPKTPLVEQARRVLQFLNEKTGKHFRAGKENVKLITARLKDGATVEECEAVVALKTREWKYNEEMAEYLRPATLFNATKFAQYLGEVPDEQNATMR